MFRWSRSSLDPHCGQKERDLALRFLAFFKLHFLLIPSIPLSIAQAKVWQFVSTVFAKPVDSLRSSRCKQAANNLNTQKVQQKFSCQEVFCRIRSPAHGPPKMLSIARRLSLFGYTRKLMKKFKSLFAYLARSLSLSSLNKFSLNLIFLPFSSAAAAANLFILQLPLSHLIPFVLNQRQQRFVSRSHTASWFHKVVNRRFFGELTAFDGHRLGWLK